MLPLPLEVALPDPLVEGVWRVGVAPAAVLVVVVRLAQQPHPPPGLHHLPHMGCGVMRDEHCAVTRVQV